MAHYALLDENNVVVNIITGRNENEVVDGISDWEAYYSQETGYTAVRTSYNTRGGEHLEGGTPFRVNYAIIGGTFDEAIGTDGAFVWPQPTEYPSWTLNTSTYMWEPPVELPEDGIPNAEGSHKKYVWWEPETAWVCLEERPDVLAELYPDQE